MITALVGGQYGSEGKGLIAAHLAKDYTVHVRTGAPNAGHTFYHPDTGRKWVMQQIPCGWIDPNTHLVIGAGAVVDMDQLNQEAWDIEQAGYSVRSRIYIDENASVLNHVRHDEGGVHGSAHEKIGSTGKGVGLARMARINRDALVRDFAWAKMDLVRAYREDLEAEGFHVTDTVQALDSWLGIGATILLEGTQGSGLSLTHGPWPFVTSADTNSAQLCADAGVSPRLLTKTILVMRTYPIRVAGRSGPLFEETTWEEIGVDPEYTTVTKKMRRVGMWDHNLAARSVVLNRPCTVALTFLDYVFPDAAGITSPDDLSSDSLRWVRKVERTLPYYTFIEHLGTGPNTVVNL